MRGKEIVCFMEQCKFSNSETKTHNRGMADCLLPICHVCSPSSWGILSDLAEELLDQFFYLNDVLCLNGITGFNVVRLAENIMRRPRYFSLTVLALYQSTQILSYHLCIHYMLPVLLMPVSGNPCSVLFYISSFCIHSRTFIIFSLSISPSLSVCVCVRVCIWLSRRACPAPRACLFSRNCCTSSTTMLSSTC